MQASFLQRHAASIVFAVAVAIIIAGIGARFSLPQDNSPSLSETLAWMDSTYNDHALSGGSGGYGVTEEDYASSDRPIEMTIQSFAYTGCNIALRFDDVTFDKAGIADIETKGTQSFNLADIDPLSIRIAQYASGSGGLACGLVPDARCDTESIEFETRNRRPHIWTTSRTIFGSLKGREADSRFAGYSSTWFVGDLDYAKKFETALRHAIALCGGGHATF